MVQSICMVHRYILVVKVCISQLSCGISEEERPLLVGPARYSESRASLARPTTRLDKNVCTRKEIYFIFICITLVILMSISNTLTHLITLLLYSGHQFMYGLAVSAIQCKVVLFVTSIPRKWNAL